MFRHLRPISFKSYSKVSLTKYNYLSFKMAFILNIAYTRKFWNKRVLKFKKRPFQNSENNFQHFHFWFRYISHFFPPNFYHLFLNIAVIFRYVLKIVRESFSTACVGFEYIFSWSLRSYQSLFAVYMYIMKRTKIL